MYSDTQSNKQNKRDPFDDPTAANDRFNISLKKDEYLRDMKRADRKMKLQKRRYNLIANEEAGLNENINKINDMESLKNLLTDLKSNDSHSCYTALVTLRVATTDELGFLDNFEGINELISLIIRYCDLKEDSQIQTEAIRIVSNLSAGDHFLSQKLIDLNFIDLALKSFDSYSPEITDQILLTLGNVVSESTYARDTILNTGIADVLVSYIEQFNSKSGMWAFCNLFRGHPAPQFEFCSKYLPFLMKKINASQNQEDIEVSEDCLGTLWELSEEESINGPLLQNETYLLALLQVLGSGKLLLISPAIKILGNILINTPQASFTLMEEGLAAKAMELLSLKNIQVKRETCTLLANLASENKPLVETFIKSGLISKLLHIINADSREIMKEACWIICKICRLASTEQIMQLNQLKVLDVISDTLTDREPVILTIVLDIIYEFLSHGQNLLDEDGENYFLIVLDNVGAITKLEKLQNSPSELVQNKVETILRKFFDVEEI